MNTKSFKIFGYKFFLYNLMLKCMCVCNDQVYVCNDQVCNNQ